MIPFRWFLPAVLLALALSAGCAHLQSLIKPPRVRVVSVTPTGLTPEAVSFVAKLSVTNQIPIRLPLQRLDFTVGVNGRRALEGFLDMVPAVAGSATQLVEVPFQLAYADLLALVKTAASQDTLQLGFKGRVFIGGEFTLPSVPFSFSLDLPVPRLPTVSWAGVKLLAREKRVTLGLKIKNPNTFPLDLQTLSVEAKLSGVKYSLLGLSEPRRIAAKGSEVIHLQLGDSLQKTAAVFTRLLTGQKLDFQVSGLLESDTAFGRLKMPIHSQGKSR